MLSLLAATLLPAAQNSASTTVQQTSKRCGFYLHAAWKYNYPFSVRTWSRADYNQMFHLLKRLGFDTVMLWPVVEAVTVPLSDTDAKAVRGFRFTITDAQRAGLESLVGWWKINGYVFDGVGTEEFRWHFAETSQVVALQQWCAQNVKDVAAGDLAVKQLVARNVLPEQVARARVRELLDR